MNMRISGLVNDSIVDGPGFRFAVFAQGCPHHCPGCHNPQTHDFGGGRDMDTAEIIDKFLANPLLDGITLTGGEPFRQSEACLELAKAARGAGLNVWAYSGYTYEEILRDPAMRALLSQVDVLVDGRFVLAERSLSLRFRGSRNQRLIDVPKSLESGTVVQIPDN
jgi:anaerobic ribonucleoside-triphosphate reductase activating protein